MSKDGVTMSNGSMAVASDANPDYGYNRIIFQNKFPIQWGIREALVALRCLLSLAGGDNFHDSFLATHIVYALSAYNATKTLEKTLNGYGAI